MLPDPSTSDAAPLTVMTYNVYVGADTLPLLGITNLLEVPGAVADLYNKVIASDFPGRAEGIASTIAEYQASPHRTPRNFIDSNPDPWRSTNRWGNRLKRSSWIFSKF